MASTPPERAFATSASTANSSTIDDVPATTPAQEFLSSSSRDSCTGSASVVESTSKLPSKETGMTLALESFLELTSKLPSVKTEKKSHQEVGEILLSELSPLLGNETELMEMHYKSVIKFMQNEKELSPGDGLPLLNDDLQLYMHKNHEFIASSWIPMSKLVNSIIPKMKEGNPDSIVEFLEVTDELKTILKEQSTAVYLFTKHVDELCSHLNK